MNNFFSGWQLIIDRLKAKVSGVPELNFRQVANIDWVIRNALHNSINVGLFSYEAISNEGGSIAYGRNQRYKLNYVVIYTARNVADNGISGLTECGEKALEILPALQGYLLTGHVKELKSEPTKLPVIDANGFVHISFLFSCELIVKGFKDG